MSADCTRASQAMLSFCETGVLLSRNQLAHKVAHVCQKNLKALCCAWSPRLIDQSRCLRGRPFTKSEPWGSVDHGVSANSVRAMRVGDAPSGAAATEAEIHWI